MFAAVFCHSKTATSNRSLALSALAKAYLPRGMLLGLCLVFALLRPGFAQAVPDYRLGGGDSVKISVFMSPELTTEARISEQGLVNFPLVGTVKISGLSVAQAEAELSRQLKQGGFISKPQVLMTVTAYRSQLVSVLGNVGKPGRYPLEMPGLRLSELLAQLGGIAPGGSEIVAVTRKTSSGSLEQINVDLGSIYIDGKAELDILMQAGDSVYVGRQTLFYISGSVGRPGSYPIDRHMTVGQAIAKGGSFTLGASYTLQAKEAGVRLLRRNSNGEMIEFTPKMSDLVLPDDQIFVRESLF
jgi:polysaccharide biosynthesis/export protein